MRGGLAASFIVWLCRMRALGDALPHGGPGVNSGGGAAVLTGLLTIGRKLAIGVGFPTGRVVQLPPSDLKGSGGAGRRRTTRMVGPPSEELNCSRAFQRRDSWSNRDDGGAMSAGK